MNHMVNHTVTYQMVWKHMVNHCQYVRVTSLLR